jgi:hypothetical protein
MMYVDDTWSYFHDTKITSLSVNSAERKEILDGGLDTYTELSTEVCHISTNYSGNIFQQAVYLWM